MAELGYRDAKHLAELVDEIPYGTLRNAVSGRDPMRLERVYVLARRLRRDGENLRDTVADILAAGDGEPDEPPKQPTRDPKTPPKRQEKTGPRRAA